MLKLKSVCNKLKTIPECEMPSHPYGSDLEKANYVWNLRHVYKPLQLLEKEISATLAVEIYSRIKKYVPGRKLYVKIVNLVISRSGIKFLEFDVFIKIGTKKKLLLSGIKGNVLVSNTMRDKITQSAKDDLKQIFQLVEDINNDLV